LGVKVYVNKLFMERNSDIVELQGHREYFYICVITGGKVGTGRGPEFQVDSHYKGKYVIKWVEIDTLPTTELRPVEVRDKIIKEYYDQKYIRNPIPI